MCPVRPELLDYIVLILCPALSRSSFSLFVLRIFRLLLSIGSFSVRLRSYLQAHGVTWVLLGSSGYWWLAPNYVGAAASSVAVLVILRLGSSVQLPASPRSSETFSASALLMSFLCLRQSVHLCSFDASHSSGALRKRGDLFHHFP